MFFGIIFMWTNTEGSSLVEHYGALTWNMFGRSSDFPKLKGRAIWVRNLTPALLHVFKEVMVHDNTQHRLIRLCMERLKAMDEVVEANKSEFTFSKDVAASFLQMTYDFLSANNALADFFHNQNIMLFHITIKYHYLVHIALRSVGVSPSLAWCYGGESFLKHIKRICRQASFGTRMEKLSDKIIEQWMCGMHQMLSGKQLLK